ncbi:MAG: hypothetical protein RIC56_22725 [Pseudomonadales bacterium]
MIYEIRDYHYRPDLFDAYKAWADEAVPVLRAKLDVLGFWIDSGAAPEITGTHPIDSPIGSANVTWIIRWDNLEARAEGFKAAIESPEWQAVWARHPDPNGYLQMSGRFMDAM